MGFAFHIVSSESIIIFEKGSHPLTYSADFTLNE